MNLWESLLLENIDYWKNIKGIELLNTFCNVFVFYSLRMLPMIMKFVTIQKLKQSLRWKYIVSSFQSILPPCAWQWSLILLKVKSVSHSVMSNFLQLRDLSMEFSRQEYWSELPFPSPGDPPDLGTEPWSPSSPAFWVDSLPLSHWGSPCEPCFYNKSIYIFTYIGYAIYVLNVCIAYNT